jgi:heterodisulfide reductase subunit A
MARLDKTFPTNDCSICIEAPKMVDVLRHPNIELLTYSEVKEVKGSVGNFKVKILKKPRYVIEDKCNGCGKCEEVCIVSVPSEFDLGTKLRKAIYLPFPQATPKLYTLDMDNCKKFGGGCRDCVSACRDLGLNAVDFWQRKKELEIEVGSIVVATGFEYLEPTMRPEYGYGIYKNVLTSLQYERILCASGPTSGQIVRPSDKEKPSKVAWIQCVLSRDTKVGKSYCSRVCCTYATKEAMITKERDPSIETYVFYIDRRTYGKGFEEYVRRAEKLGVKYIRSKPGEVLEDPKTRDLTIRYENMETGEVEELKVNLLVLCSAMVPSRGNEELAKILGIEVDEDGFFKSAKPWKAPFETNVEGIYLAGSCQEPMDIPDSISQASGAAAKAVTPLVEARGIEAKKVELPPEIEVKPTDEPRIGVFVCDCGSNIRGTINVPKVVEYAKTLKHVVHAEEMTFACSTDSQPKIKDAIKAKGLNRVVVAACTPRTHEYLFRRTCREAGLNPYLFEFANIREQCSWVHMHEPELATEKAKDLVKMAVAKARLLMPEEEYKIPVGKESLVIGGGLAGITAALSLADMGFKVTLVEKENELGGMLKKLHKIFPYDIPADEIIRPQINRVNNHENIKVYTGTKIKGITGYIGNYEVTISKNTQEEKFKVSTIIVATGSKEINPHGHYGYGKYGKVITQLELERMLKEDALAEPKCVVMINCVGARNEERPYCCRVGCGVSIKNAKYIKKLYPNANIYVLYRDMVILGKEEEYHRLVAEEYGVNFIRYLKDREPQVYQDQEKLIVKVYDALLDEEIELEPDLLVLTTATEGNEEVKELSKMLKVPIGIGNFFQEAHVKIRPLDFAVDGIYLCGAARSPKTVMDTIHEAIGAAMRASIPMAQGMVVSEGIYSTFDEEKCTGCGLCVKICPYSAITLEKIEGKIIAKGIKGVCKGCGTCVAQCPLNAIDQRHFTTAQLREMIIAATEGVSIEERKKLPRIIGFLCNWCGYAGADMAGLGHFSYPTSIRIIRTMCSGRVDGRLVLEAFKHGADGVLICGCYPQDCHYISGATEAQKMAERTKKMLARHGIDERRLRFESVSATEGKKFADLVSEFTEFIKKIGPQPTTNSH